MIRTFDGNSFKRVGGKPGDRSPAAGFSRLRVTYTAAGGETSVNLASLNPQFAYYPGQAQIEVKRSSGGVMIAGSDFFETSTTTINFPSTDPLLSGEIVEVTLQHQVTGIYAAQPRPDMHEETATAGQTLISASFSWRYNMTACGVRVYINGIRQRRGIDFFEVNQGSGSTNQVTLADALAGAENLILEPTYQALDTSAAATAFSNEQISYLQSLMALSTQAFVDEQSDLISAPSTTIVNRSKIPNLTNDLRASMAIDRLTINQIYEVSGEQGPNGERVFGVHGDNRNLIRFVGNNWSQTHGSFGVGPVFSGTANGTDFIEVTFFGTDLNLLFSLSSYTAFNITASVDGGADGPNLAPTAASGILAGRNYANNAVLNIAQNLSLGIHTVKLKINTATGYTPIFTGFEFINESSTINVNPGTSYKSAKKYSTLTGSSITYSSDFESGSLHATRGGRVVVYQKSDGTIAKSATPTNSAQGNTTAADHSNEDLIRSFYWREFAAGRSDDMSSLGASSATHRAFTIDDGSTSIQGSSLITANFDGVGPTTSGNSLYFTFVGTGLDIEIAGNDGLAYSSSYSFEIDGVTVSGGTQTGAVIFGRTNRNGIKRLKIVSGLPYGTHSFRLNFVVAGTGEVIRRFHVYGPKKPIVPETAIELADYNVMANYSAAGVAGNTIQDHADMYSGTLWKSSIREFTFGGTGWNIPTLTTNHSSLPGGYYVMSNVNNDYVEYTFFGTGIAVQLTDSSAGTSTFTAAIDGTPTAGATDKISITDNGAGSYTVNTVTGFLAARLVFSGLSLGLHKIRLTKTAGSGNFAFVGMHIITPIHAYKTNDYPTQSSITGSCGLLDRRNTSAIPKEMSSEKAIAQAFGMTSAPTVSSNAGVLVPVPDLAVTITTTGYRGIECTGWIHVLTLAGQTAQISIVVNGDRRSPIAGSIAGVGQNEIPTVNISAIVPVGPGTHRVELYWGSNGTGSILAQDVARALTVKEL